MKTLIDFMAESNKSEKSWSVWNKETTEAEKENRTLILGYLSRNSITTKEQILTADFFTFHSY